MLDLEKPRLAGAEAGSSREIGRAIDEDRAEAIVLGCAGMTDLAASFAEEHGVPVLDGVACAVKLCEALVAIGLKTSKAAAMPGREPSASRGRSRGSLHRARVSEPRRQAAQARAHSACDRPGVRPTC